MPRPIFTGTERAEWSPSVYTSRHAELQIRTDLTKIIQSARTPSQLEAARGRLTPFLRDTLVGFELRLLRATRRRGSAFQSALGTLP